LLNSKRAASRAFPALTTLRVCERGYGHGYRRSRSVSGGDTARGLGVRVSPYGQAAPTRSVRFALSVSERDTQSPRLGNPPAFSVSPRTRLKTGFWVKLTPMASWFLPAYKTGFLAHPTRKVGYFLVWKSLITHFIVELPNERFGVFPL